MAKVLRVFLVHRIYKRKSMFASFYFDLEVYINKIAIEMKIVVKINLKKAPSIHRERKTQHPPSQLVLKYLQVLLSANMNS